MIIKLDFGIYISSLIKGDFLVNILSTINEKLYPFISFDLNKETSLPETKYKENIIINDKIQPKELFSIIINYLKKVKKKMKNVRWILI